jgi:hypothetical protein
VTLLACFGGEAGLQSCFSVSPNWFRCPFTGTTVCDPRPAGCSLHALVQPTVGPTPINPIGVSGQAIWIYWVTASACVFLLPVAYYRRRGRDTGLRGKTWPMVDAGAMLLAFVLMVAHWFDGWPIAIGTFGH